MKVIISKNPAAFFFRFRDAVGRKRLLKYYMEEELVEIEIACYGLLK